MQFIDDVRYAMRQFAHVPGFTATAVLTLALGIGATTAIFTLVHAVLLKSLPVTKPSELIRVGDNENCCVKGGFQGNWSLFSYDKYKTFRDGTKGFSELAAFQAARSLMGVRRNGSNQPAESLRTQYVSGNYFLTFGVSAYAGRMLSRRTIERELSRSRSAWACGALRGSPRRSRRSLRITATWLRSTMPFTFLPRASDIASDARDGIWPCGPRLEFGRIGGIIG
jgi:hypothetical protein